MAFVITSPIILQTSDGLDFFSVSWINNNGEIVGYGGHLTGQDKIGISWQAGAATILSPLSGYAYAEAFGVSDSGVVAGLSLDENSFVSQATEWLNGNALPLSDDGYGSGAFAVNDRGQVAGYISTDSNYDTEAALWTNGKLTLLGHLSGDIYSGAAAINDAGEVVGTSQNAAGVGHAFLWQNGTMTALSTLPGGTSSEAMALNKSGQIVGYGTDSKGVQQAILWVNGAATELPGLSATGAAEAEAINDSGQIVGYATTASGVKHAVLWQNGQITDLSSLGEGSGLNEAYSINDSGQIVAQETDPNTGAIYQVTFSIASAPQAVTAQSAVQAYQANPQIGAEQVSDTAANVVSSLAGLETIAEAGKLLGITLTDPTEPTITITQAQYDDDRSALFSISTAYKLAVTGVTANEAPVLPNNLVSVTVLDSAENVSDHLYDLAWMVDWKQLTSITLTDSAPITIPYGDLSQDLVALPVISSPYSLTVTDATLSQAVSLPGTTHLTTIGITDTVADVLAGGARLATLEGSYSVSVTINDSAANLVGNIDTLAPLVNTDAITAITLTDSGTPTLSITAAQLASDLAVVKLIQGNFNLSIDAAAPNLTIQGYQTGGHGNTVLFHGYSNDYDLAAASNGQSLIVTDVGTGRSSVDTLTGVNALQFLDTTVIVAAAPSSQQVTSGNITELYGAVFGREPDIAGLSFYENFLANNPNTSLVTFAQWFLQSNEYQNNPANSYTPDATGDAAFITNLYTNLLHRAPAAGDTNFYETNVIAPLVKGLTEGTTAYNNALALGRATVVTYFSQSPEFLSDVQITAQQPASSQHWLMLT